VTRIMADEMLARLDQLQRGAREFRPRRQEYEAPSNSGRYDTYATELDYFDGDGMYGDENAFPQGANGTLPVIITAVPGPMTDRMHRCRCDGVPSSLRYAPFANAATPADRTTFSSPCASRPEYGDSTFQRL
jgi:hypothetical protein